MAPVPPPGVPLRRAALGLALALGCAAPAGAAEQPRTTHLEAVGSEDVRGAVTADEALALARDKARREAIRRACGTLVSAALTSVVAQQGDQTQSLTVSEASTRDEGIVIGEAWEPVQSVTLTDPATRTPFFRYTVRGRFEVAPLPEADTSLAVKLALGRQELVAGQDTLSFTVQPSEQVFAMVFNLAADEKVYPIYPNAHVKEPLRLPGQAATQLPREADPIVLRPQPAKGHKQDLERIRVIVSRRQLSPPAWGPDGAIELAEFFRWQHQRLRQEAFAQAEATYRVRAPGAGR